MSIAADNWVTRHRINVDEYYRMAEVGLLAHDACVELIEGEVIDMAPIGSKHAGIVDRVAVMIARAIDERANLGIQRPVHLGELSEPQPDLVVLKPRADSYTRAHPVAADLLLVVEVSDTTLRYDRDIKAPLYARHGIPEMWLIDVNSKQLHCFREPRDGAYQNVTVFQGGSIQPLMLADVSVNLDSVLSL